MGLFDFFRRKPRMSIGGDEIDRSVGQPRCHHYALAHYALRGVAFEHPLAFLGVLASPDAQRFLAELLQSVSKQCKEREPEPDFTVEQIVVHKRRVGQYPCAIVEMPQPRATTEAYFVAAVLLADTEKPLQDKKDLTLRYVTLEMGSSLAGNARTVLGEWAVDGSHVNYGTGPNPKLEAFVGQLAEVLARNPQQPKPS
jgi:hypothetical protein